MSWATVDEASKVFHVTPRTIRNWINRGWIPAQQHGPKLLRIRYVDVYSLALVIRPLQLQQLNRNMILEVVKTFNFPSQTMGSVSGKR